MLLTPVISKMNHTNVVRFFGVTLPPSLAIVMEFCPYGSLSDLLYDESYSFTLPYASQVRSISEVSTTGGDDQTLSPPGSPSLLLLPRCDRNSPGSTRMQTTRQPLPLGLCFKIVEDIAAGLEYLHSSLTPPLTHRDLRSLNIFVRTSPFYTLNSGMKFLLITQ